MLYYNISFLFIFVYFLFLFGFFLFFFFLTGSHRQHVSSIVFYESVIAVTAHGCDEIPQIVRICILFCEYVNCAI